MKKVSAFLLLFCLFLLIGTAPCSAESDDRFQWITSTDTNGYWFDKETIKFSRYSMAGSVSSYPNTNIIECWLKITYNQNGIDQAIETRKENQMEISGFDRLHFDMSLVLLDTRTKEFSFVSSTFYDTDGKTLDSITFRVYPSAIVPNSIGETILKALQTFATANKQTLLNRS